MKGSADLATSIGWEARRFHYIERPQPLDHYLKPPPTPEGQREKGARDVRRMFDRMIKKQEAEHGAG